MGSHTSCSNWEYETHPDQAGLKTRCERLVRKLLRSCKSFDKFGFDTRVGHSFMFKSMVPSDCECIAGQYRGDSLCVALTNYSVQVGGDARVGVPPYLVGMTISNFEAQCTALYAEFQKFKNHRKPGVPEEVVLARFAAILAEMLCQFLTIHPYANGNGHAARLLVWVIMVRCGYPPKAWPLDDSPPYGPALTKYRDQDKKPLIQLLVRSILG